MLIYFGIISFLGLGVIIEKISERKRIGESFFIFSLLLLILFLSFSAFKYTIPFYNPLIFSSLVDDFLVYTSNLFS